MKNKTIGITMGDPAGIGPEIILKSLKNLDNLPEINLLVIGSGEIIKDAQKFTEIEIEINHIYSDDKINFKRNSLNLLDLNNIEKKDFNYGEIQQNCGKASVEYINKAIELAKNNIIEAIVTAPIHKEAIKMAGIPYAGHTEILAENFQTDNYAMMLAEGDFRVVHVSTHVPLKKACEKVKKERIYEVIKLAHDFLSKMEFENPRIAVAGLNPHAGEHGLFGEEEKEEILPAVKKAAGENIEVTGPISPDTVFAKARANKFDIVVAMYHDQGHIPMKTVGFNFDKEKQEWLSVSGVNVTLGLPVPRTSVDHGVAFDIAGKNEASPDSLEAAIEMAINFID